MHDLLVWIRSRTALLRWTVLDELDLGQPVARGHLVGEWVESRTFGLRTSREPGLTEDEGFADDVKVMGLEGGRAPLEVGRLVFHDPGLVHVGIKALLCKEDERIQEPASLLPHLSRFKLVQPGGFLTREGEDGAEPRDVLDDVCNLILGDVVLVIGEPELVSEAVLVDSREACQEAELEPVEAVELDLVRDHLILSLHAGVDVRSLHEAPPVRIEVGFLGALGL